MNNENNNITVAEGITEEKTEIIEVPFRPDEEAPYIFISYAHADRGRVFPIIKRIYEKGWRVWYDEGLPVGNETDYLASLAAHIRGCQIILLFVTETSVKREFVMEKEIEFGISRANKRVIFLQLDKDAVIPDSVLLNAASPTKFPHTDEDGLEAVLESIEGLTCFEQRKAEGYRVESLKEVIEAAEEGDEYDFEKCEGGIRLLKYKGSEEYVKIPNMYKGQPVVELYETFECNETVKTVRIPATVRKISDWTFNDCDNLTDVYIPASVKEIQEYAFDYTECNIHCENDIEAQWIGEKVWILKNRIVTDIALDSVDQAGVEDKSSYAFCSYADDKKESAEQIIRELVDNNCSVVVSGPLSEKKKLKSFGKAACLVVFFSKGYIDEDEIEYLKMAIREGKSYVIYALDNTTLPSDIDITISSEQQLRIDKNEKEETAKLIEWLDKKQCRRPSADIPNYEYTTNSDGGIILTKYTGSDSEVIIPREHAKHPIVDFGKIFCRCINLTSVIIPESITSISDGAFSECSNLISVSIPNSVKSIGKEAFSLCKSLSSITLPNSITTIDYKAFYRCKSLTSITIPDYVTNIGILAFAENSGLKSVKISNSVTSIGSGAFCECTSLSSIMIPDNTIKIDRSAFAGCVCLTRINTSHNNKCYTSVDGILMSKDCKTLVAFPAGLSGKYKLSDSVTSIGDEAFRGCSGLTSVTIPNGVTSIGENAFAFCSNLVSITIPDSVTNIADGAFWNCSSLLSVKIPNSVTKISENTFSGCSSLASVTIPDSVTQICGGSFSECSSLVAVKIPHSVISIGKIAFWRCSNLVSVTLPDNLPEINDNTFAESKKITFYCSEGSEAWQVCEKNNIPHKPLEQPAQPAETPAEQPTEAPAPVVKAEPAAAPAPAPVTQAEPKPNTSSRRSPARWLIPIILLALLAAAVGVQLSGLFDILGWLGGLL